MRDSDVIEQAARVLAGLEPGEEWPTNESLGGGLTGTRDDEYRQAMLDEALALADAGLLARPLPAREEVIDLLKWSFGPFLSQDPAHPDRFWGQSADAVLELMKGQDA